MARRLKLFSGNITAKKPVKILILAVATTAVIGIGTCGFLYANGTLGGETEQEIDYTLHELTVDQLADGNYYVKTGTAYYPLVTGQFASTAPHDSRVPKEADPVNRYAMFGEDDQQIPTMYKDSELIFKANTPTLPSSFTLERFKDEGWSIGMRGITKAEGSGKYHVIVDAVHTYRQGSSISALQAPLSGEVIVDKINGTPLSESNVSEGGTIIGLTRDQTYSVDAYTGTTFIGMDAIADTHMFTSFEVYTLSDISMNPNGYVVINLPDYMQSGYYMIDGLGMFRYINKTTAEGASGVAMNVPYYMGKDNLGNTLTNPANGVENTKETETKDKTTSDFEWNYKIAIDNSQKELNVVVDFSEASAIVNGELVSESSGAQIPGAEIPSATLVSPDGKEYILSTSKDDYQMTTKVENPGTGTWILTVKGMYARTFDVTSSFEGNTSNMVVKNGNDDVEMKVYLENPLTDGVFSFKWSDKDHAANFVFKDPEGKDLYDTTKDQSKIVAQSYGQMDIHMGALNAGEYSFTIKGESLGHIYFTYADAAATQATE